MRIASVIAQYLMGIVFVVFGLNGFLHFLPMPPMSGLPGQFMGAIFVSHYYVIIFGLQLISGILLLANRYVPLALTWLGPIIVNILCFHIFMAPSGIAPGLVVTVLWLLTYSRMRAPFSGLFQQRA